MPECWVSGEASGALRALVTAYKDEQRRDLRRALAGWLAPALGAAVGANPPARRAAHGRGLVVVPVSGSPRARRKRGDVPLLPLVGEAVQGLSGRVVVADVLVPTRVTRDQSTLDSAQRASNLAGAMVVRERQRAVVDGAVCLVVDDLVTTGATFAEAARALREAGAAHVLGAALGATRKHVRSHDIHTDVPLERADGRV